MNASLSMSPQEPALWLTRARALNDAPKALPRLCARSLERLRQIALLHPRPSNTAVTERRPVAMAARPGGSARRPAAVAVAVARAHDDVTVRVISANTRVGAHAGTSVVMREHDRHTHEKRRGPRTCRCRGRKGCSSAR